MSSLNGDLDRSILFHTMIDMLDRCNRLTGMLGTVLIVGTLRAPHRLHLTGLLHYSLECDGGSWLLNGNSAAFVT